MFLCRCCMEKLIALGILLIFVGIAVLFIGVMGTALQKQEDTQVKAGGVILIGPIPIVFGTDKTMVFISIAGAVLLLLAYLAWRR